MGCVSSKPTARPHLLGRTQPGACGKVDHPVSLSAPSSAEDGGQEQEAQAPKPEVEKIQAEAIGDPGEAQEPGEPTIETEVQNSTCWFPFLGDVCEWRRERRETWEEDLAQMSSTLTKKLEDPHFVARSCDLDGSGNLDQHELRQAAMVFGARLTEEKLQQVMNGQERISEDQFATLVARLCLDLPETMKMPRAVPHSLRGMALGQLKVLDKLFLSSGWLDQQCCLHNEQHEVAIGRGEAFKQEANLYAMDAHIVTPMTKPGHCLARDEDHCKSIPDARWETSFSELVNPSGCSIHFFVSHFWGHLFKKTLAALQIWARNRFEAVGTRHPDSVVYWICLFALNQHRVAEEVGKLPMQGPFNAALAHAIGGAVMVLDEEVHPFSRIWCLFEVHRLDQLKQPFELICEKGPLGKLHDAAVDEAGRAAAEKVLDDAASALWKATAASARASDGDDLIRIHDVIRDPPLHNFFKKKDWTEGEFTQEPQGEPETGRGFCPYRNIQPVEVYGFSRFDEKVHALLSTPLLDHCLAVGNSVRSRECLLHGAHFTQEKLLKVLALLQVEERQTLLDDLLVVASGRGSAEEVALLLSLSVKVSDKSVDAASQKGHAPTVKLLLEGMQTQSDQRWWFLQSAARGGHAEVVKLLLEAGAPLSQETNGHPLLLDAACGGHDMVVRLLLEARADAAETTPLGITALMAASQMGQKDVVRLLLDADADPCAVDQDGCTSLLLAANRCDADLTRLLLERGADVSASDKQGFTALLVASRGGHEANVKLLLEVRADIAVANKAGQTSLIFAAASGFESILGLLLGAGADLKARTELGKTALIHASTRGEEATVRMLLDAGADVDEQDYMACTSLMLASMGGHEAVAKVLLAARADFDKASEPAGKTSLMVASVRGHVSLVKLLLQAGADLAAADKQGQASLLLASDHGQEQVVRVLLEAGADVAAASCRGLTSLIAASQKGHGAVVKLLLEAGAEVGAQEGLSLPLASGKGFEAVVKLLLEAGADTAATDRVARGGNGLSSLALASFGGHESVVRLLIHAGAQVEPMSFRLASREGHHEVLKLLLEAGAAGAGLLEAACPRLALLEAASGGHETVAKLLLNARADVAAASEAGETPLLVASHGGHEAVVKLLLDAGADVAAASEGGETPLLVASHEGHEAIVKLLLGAGADVCATLQGQTALWWASLQGHEGVVKLLVAAGSPIGAGSLLNASMRGHEGVVNLLQEALQERGTR